MKNTLAMFLAILACSLLGLSSAGQETTGEETVFFESVDVDVVNVEVFVTDRRGNPISDLTKEDFSLLVDGRPMPITNFYAQVAGRPTSSVQLVEDAGSTTAEDVVDPGVVPADQRLHLVLFVDNLHLRSTNRKKTFQHIREFLQTLAPEDRVTVVSQNRSLFIHTDFTNDHQLLGEVLDEVEDMAAASFAGEGTRRRVFQELAKLNNLHIQQEDLDFFEASLLNEIRGYAQSQYELARASIDSVERLVATLGGIKGRKAMIHISDGIPTNPGEALYSMWLDLYEDQQRGSSFVRDVGSYDLLREFRALGRRANAAGVTFYAIDAETDHTSIARSAAMSGGAAGIVSTAALDLLDNNVRETLELTAATTGGKRLQRTPSLTDNLRRMAADFGTFYSLGFQPASGELGEDRKIEVEVNLKGMRVRHRETFREQNRDDRSGDSTLAALLYNVVDNPLGIGLEPGEPQAHEDGGQVLPVLVKVPIRNIALIPRGEVHAAQLTFFISVKDQKGDFRPVQKIPFHINIPAEMLEDARGREAAYSVPFLVRNGDLQAVVGVRDDYSATESTIRFDLDRWSGGGVRKASSRR